LCEDAVAQSGFDGGGVFVVEPHHLLRVTVLGQAHQTHLGDGGARGGGKDTTGIGATGGELAADLSAGGVFADHADDAALAAQTAQTGGDAAGAAKGGLFVIKVQDGHGGFLRKPLGVAEEVAVKHQVAQQQHPLAGKPVDKLDEV
jgi:hypothetical protein